MCCAACCAALPATASCSAWTIRSCAMSCETVIHENEGHYPDLRERAAYITRVVRVEEENFARTIDGGMRIFSEMLAQHKENDEIRLLRRRCLQAL